MNNILIVKTIFPTNFDMIFDFSQLKMFKSSISAYNGFQRSQVVAVVLVLILKCAFRD